MVNEPNPLKMNILGRTIGEMKWNIMPTWVFLCFVVVVFMFCCCFISQQHLYSLHPWTKIGRSNSRAEVSTVFNFSHVIKLVIKLRDWHKLWYVLRQYQTNERRFLRGFGGRVGGGGGGAYWKIVTFEGGLNRAFTVFRQTSHVCIANFVIFFSAPRLIRKSFSVQQHRQNCSKIWMIRIRYVK